nr:MAG: RNA-dependent RNA polymerase [Riboviria sp.]
MGTPKVRHVTILPSVSTDVRLGVHNSNITNLEKGVLERVFFVHKDGEFRRPPLPDPKTFVTRLSVFKSALVRRVPSTTPTSLEDFPSFYWGRKRTIYQNAVDSLYRRGIDSTDSMIKCFVKAEKINFSAKKDPVPRIISPRDPRYNVEVGCYLKQIEHPLYDAIGQLFGSPTVAKGLNVEAVAGLFVQKWTQFTKPVAIGLDASRFDQHVSETALRWEHSVYKEIYRHDRKLAKLLSWQLKNRCKGYTTDGRLKYTTRGTRMSGDMNTAMGNCLIMCALVYAYSKERGVPIQLMNNGDDCVVILEDKHLASYQYRMSEWFEEMGFTMKIEEPVKCLEKIEFCQMHPVFDGCRYVMVRNPKIAIAKDSISIKPLNSKSLFEKWIGAVGEGGVSLTGGIPIMQSFYCCLERNSHGKRLKNDTTMETGWWYLSKGMSRKVQDVRDEARFSFYLAFDILPDLQVAIESYYKSLILEWRAPRVEPTWLANIWM